MRVVVVIISTLFTTFPVSIYAAEHTYYEFHGFPRPYTEQFQSWLPKYKNVLHGISTGVCNETLRDYRNAYQAPPQITEASQLLSICYQHEACILDTLEADQIANFQSAGVILGLLPTLLASVGPSVAKIALLSAHRHVLSFLISKGAPAIYPTRMFVYNDPGSILMGADSKGRDQNLTIPPFKSKGLMLLVSTVQYLVALAAAGNVFYTSLSLGQSSVLSWGCTANFPPVLWTCLASVVHIVAAASYAMPRKMVNNSKERKGDGHLEGSEPFLRARRQQSSAHDAPQRWISRLGHRLIQEVTVCANQKTGEDSIYTSATRWPLLLNVSASCCGFVHTILGTIVLSSLQLVSVSDVLNVVLWRWVLSTVACRLLLIFELAELQARKKGAVESG